MSEEIYQIEDLIISFLKGELAAEDQVKLQQWIDLSEKNKELFHSVVNKESLQQKLKEFHAIETTEKEESRKRLIIPAKAVVRNLKVWRRIAVAASVLLIVGLGSYFLFFNKTKREIAVVQPQAERFKNDIAPGRAKATLTLANGSVIILDSATKGKLVEQGTTSVINQEGQLQYQVKGTNHDQDLYNILSTAKGESYSTVLADGSKVWLNSASSMKFPVAFGSKERKVEITGEAYFEVNHDAGRPFTVSVNGMEVRVLGTHFNINAYKDEASIRTTLLEGVVRVTKGDKAQILSPGEQAQLSGEGELKKVNNVDLDETVAWVNGRFQFKSSDIETLMRQIQRWYDVDVIYEGTVTKKFSGKIPRSMTAINVFKILEETGGVHFSIDGKKITVRP